MYITNKQTIVLSDIEECVTGVDNCHAHANCTNTNGSFYCTCHHGYSGDGVKCVGKQFKLIELVLQFSSLCN